MSNESNNDTPETDAIAEMAHNLVLDWDCRDRGDTTEKPVVVPAEFARRLERERDELRRLWEAECAESRKLEQAREYNAGLVAELEATLSDLL
jgi:hypothetical protein